MGLDSHIHHMIDTCCSDVLVLLFFLYFLDLIGESFAQSLLLAEAVQEHHPGAHQKELEHNCDVVAVLLVEEQQKLAKIVAA